MPARKPTEISIEQIQAALRSEWAAGHYSYWGTSFSVYRDEDIKKAAEEMAPFVGNVLARIPGVKVADLPE